MADQPQNPADPERDMRVSDEIVDVQVRRSPRYGRIMILGAVIGVVVAMILTFAFDGNAEPTPGGAVYSDGQVFGFLTLVCGSIGVLLAGVLALVLDRIVGRTTRSVRVDHETVRGTD